jgi:NADH pyrophosphatase NudC (nudix superfamily)
MPFLERRARRVTVEEHETSTLLAERERVVNSLQELEFDYKLGKVPEEDYPTQRANLLQRGADILRKLDELAPQNVQSDKDAVVERALAARRKKNSSQKGGLTDDDIESMISARRRGRKEKSAGFCPKCGKPVMASDKFCPACGKALT